MESIGKLFVGAGLLLSLITWVATLGTFFSEGDTALGLILLLIPPSEIVLPWVASTTLGAMSAVGAALFFVGGAMSKD